jgi:alcohol/geraniol dehydrogenase (NADP+)
MRIQAYAAEKAKGRLEPFTYDAELGEHDALVKVQYCGICHSDVHLADGEWGQVFPLVPGHEVVGEVMEVGRGCRQVRKGMRVGVGWQCDSCGSCEWCDAHEEVLCAGNKATCMGHHGGFADHVVVNERFAFPLPDGLDGASAAPLLCGGATVYTPLREYTREGGRVAVVGIGGLGHLALQFASKMGRHVTAVSTRADKKAEAVALGAHEFLVGTPKPESFDVIVNTAHATMDMDAYLAALRPKGVFVQLGVGSEAMKINAFPLIGGHKKVAGSAIGHPGVIREMLGFAAKHGVAARVQVMPLAAVNEALEITRRNEARYRVVLRAGA